jgi:uncharacterized protein YcaQ
VAPPILTREQARKIAVRAQLLDARRPADLLSTVEHLTFLQLDPTAVVAQNADLVAWSRLGGAHRPDDLRRALEVDRTLFEHRAQPTEKEPVIVMLRPMSQLGLYLAEMQALGTRPGQINEWISANQGFKNDVLSLLRTSGPRSSRDIPDTAQVPWESTGWTHARNVTQMLDFLASRGVVAVSGRVGKQRLWDLPERVYPTDIEIVPLAQARAERNRRWLRALGVAREKLVGDTGTEVEIEGTKGTWRLDPDATADGFVGRTALLSPFDRLVHDRVRALELFDFDFTLELYKPKDQRRWGYFVLPVLHHERLVGKIDAAANAATGRLQVNAIHHDVTFTKAMSSAVDGELAALAAWLGLDGVRMP